MLFTALCVPMSVMAQTPSTATELPFSTDFETSDDDTYWSYNNTGNSWYIGSGTNNTSGGSRALYISSTNGSTHSYDPTIASMSWAYRPFYFETAGQYILEFDWINNGWYTYYFSGVYNMLYAYLIPGNANMTTSPLSPDDDNWTPCTESYLGNVTTWQHITLPINITTPGVYYLGFLYYCYGLGGGNPPAAIDNVSLSPLGCMQPTALTVDNTTASDISIHWTPGGDESTWIVRADGGEWLEIYDTTHLFTGLAAGMLHTLEVAAVCDNGDTSLASSVTQRTSCGIISNYPWREDFTGFTSTATIPCWTHLGAGAYRFYNGEMELRPMGSTAVNIVTTPQFVDLAQLELTFTTHPEGASSGSLTVGYVTGPDASYVFTPIATYDVNEWVDPSIPFEKTVTFPNAPDTARIAFRHNPNSSNFYWYIDDIDVHQLPMCVRPYNLTLVNAEESSIELAWSDDNTGGTTYTIYYRHSDSIEWSMVTTTDTLSIIYNAMGIDTLTFVAHNTYGSDTIVTHVTVMDLAPVATFPYSTGFEPTDTDNMSWIALNGTNAWKLGNAASNSGSQAYYISNDNGVTNAYNLGANTRSYLYRAFDISDTGSYAVRFDWNAKGESNFDYLRVWLVHDTAFHVQANSFPVSSISSNSALATAVIPGWIAVGGKLNLSNGWNTETDTVAVASTGRYHLVFLWANDGSLGTNPPAAIDNVEVWNTTIFCATPIIDSVYADETEIYFSYSGEANEYEVAIVEGEWNDTSLATYHSSLLAHTFSSLTPATQYSIGVRAVCGEDNYSDWMVISVTTVEHPCYAPSNVTATDITLTTATIAWTPGEEGQTDFQIRYSTAGDTTIRTVTQSLTHTLILTGLFNNTDYSVAVRAVCGEGKYSDWSAPVTFRTLECAPVLGVTVTDITSSSAVVRWNSNGSGAYQVAYGYQGMINDNAIQNVNDTVYVITGLEENTNYSVHVRTVCAEGVYSSWTDETPFTTARETGIDDISGARISLYPNPASSTVTLMGIEGEATVTVVDMNGKVISEFRIQNSEFTFDVSGMAQGAYFVRVTGERINAIRKLIVR